jgi:hypothetical protein
LRDVTAAEKGELKRLGSTVEIREMRMILVDHQHSDSPSLFM